MRYNAFPFFKKFSHIYSHYQLKETHTPISHMSTSSSHKNSFSETISLPVYFESGKTQWLLRLIIFTWREVNVFILLYKFYPRIFHTKIGQKWLSSSGKEDFKKLVRYYYYFAIITPWRLAWTFESGSVVLEP